MTPDQRPRSASIASGAGRRARRTIPRLAVALVAATAAEIRLPLVPGDRWLARAAGALLVHDFG
jgi:hypothetical protein